MQKALRQGARHGRPARDGGQDHQQGIKKHQSVRGAPTSEPALAALLLHQSRLIASRTLVRQLGSNSVDAVMAMAETSAEAPITRIAVGAEDVKARSTDEVSARLRSFDLRRHRRVESARGPVACVLTLLLLLAVLYAARPSAPAVADAFAVEEVTGETAHLHRAEALLERQAATAAAEQAGGQAAGAAARRALRALAGAHAQAKRAALPQRQYAERPT